MGLTDATLRGVVWITGSSGVQLVVRILVIALLARLIGPESFGLMAAAVVVLTLADIISQVGTGAALVQIREITPQHVGSAYILSALLGTAIGLILWLSRDLIEQGLSLDGLGDVLAVLACILPISAIGRPASRLLQRNLEFRYIALAESGAYFVGWVVVGIGLALLGLDIWALVAAHATAVLLLALVMLVGARKSVTVAASWRAAWDLISYGGAVSLSTIFLVAGSNLDKLFVGQYFGAYQLGLYSRAFDLMGRIYKICDSAISKTLFPAFSSRQDQKDRLRAAYRRATRVAGCACLPVAAVTMVLSDEIIYVLFGPRWLESSPILQVGILLLLPKVLGKLSATLMFGLGRALAVAGVRLLYALLALGSVALASGYSPLAVVQAILLVEVLHAGLLIFLSLRLIEESISSLFRLFVSWVPLAAVVFTLALLIKLAALNLDGGPISVFAAVAATVLAGCLSCVLVAPRLFIGEEGLWLLHKFGWPYGRLN